MAEIVLGIGTSHSTQCSIGPEWWGEHAKIDRGRTPFEELAARAPDWMADELAPAVWAKKFHATQEAITFLSGKLREVSPDVLVVIGDDQFELFRDDCMPMFSIFLGEEIWDLPMPTEGLSPSRLAGMWAAHGSEPEPYRCNPDLALHLVESLVAADFDVARFTKQPEGRSLGHAWTFIRRRLMREGIPIPMVPLMVNTYFPPNQPSPARCLRLGRAVKDAIRSWEKDARVAVIASGGLSHFVVDETLDRGVIDAIKENDVDYMKAIPPAKLQAGSSEILNWVTASAALDDLTMELIDYIPGYRSMAGTGCGMTFAVWQ